MKIQQRIDTVYWKREMHELIDSVQCSFILCSSPGRSGSSRIAFRKTLVWTYKIKRKIFATVRSLQPYNYEPCTSHAGLRLSHNYRFPFLAWGTAASCPSRRPRPQPGFPKRLVQVIGSCPAAGLNAVVCYWWLPWMFFQEVVCYKFIR